MPSLAVTQPYIPKRTTDLIDTNTDPSFNNLQSAYAALAQAQQALVKAQNRPTTGANAGTIPSTATSYLVPKNSTASTFKTQVDAALVAVTTAIAAVQVAIVDANS
jgi:hypothetical protein